MKYGFLAFLSLLLSFTSLKGQSIESFIATNKESTSFTLTEQGLTVPLLVDSADFSGVHRAVTDLMVDFESVTGKRVNSFLKLPYQTKNLIIIGTAGKSSYIDQLLQKELIDKDALIGKREKYLIQTVVNPLPGVQEALVIAGSDKRGTIFGIYELSEQIGVSPWYYWADVPARKSENLYFTRGTYTEGEPAVEYRGIFINDEAPALADWCRMTYGGFNHKFYEKVYELILRLKGNFLWPAMWGRALYDDDPLSGPLADEYGIVIGTSHHEPMGRAHDEWRRYGQGKWNYETNPDVLKKFWAEGFKRSASMECITTVGMRGDGDEPMSEEDNIQLLEKIVSDQRDIIATITGKDASETLQMWALYKEVQDYYDKGMRVPDDITLLLCDDNWGNVRKLPLLNAPKRKGGYGMYYHFDYVGDPRNYKWVNTNQIERTWDQMHLTYELGVDKLWIVNVGDIKPMEYPISFFLDYSWNPGKWNAGNLKQHTINWCIQQFGEKFSSEIADMITLYTKYNARRKPELLAPETYSLVNYREAELVQEEYNQLAVRAEKIYNELPANLLYAYDQLVLFPIQACANLNEMHITAAWNYLYAKQGRNNTNEMAERVKTLFERDAALTDRYHTQMANGKWNHMMSQTHIGYTYWQQPIVQVMPEVKTTEIPEQAEMRLALEGTERFCSVNKDEMALPEFDSFANQRYYIDIYNGGKASFDYKIKSKPKWVLVSKSSGKVETTVRVWISIDWKKINYGKHQPLLIISDTKGKEYIVKITAVKLKPIKVTRPTFVESNGYVSIESEHFSAVRNTPDMSWNVIPNLGKTLSGITTLPVTATPEKYDSLSLEYDVYLRSTGEAKLILYLSPTLNYNENKGLRYAVSIDGGEEQIINFNEKFTDSEWKTWVADNIIRSVTVHTISKPGIHTIRYRVLDAGIVFQKMVFDLGGLKPAYLGAPESVDIFKND
ncbi:MAG: glycosyl hydrolase 115 family protein [Bacteroidales bacterium]